MRLLGVFGYYYPKNPDLQNFDPIEFLKANVMSIGSKLIPGVPAPSIAICDTDHLKDYEGDESAFKCMFGNIHGRLQIKGGGQRSLDNIVFIDKARVWRAFKLMNAFEYRLTTSWVMTLMILRLFYATLELEKEDLIPLRLLEGVCNSKNCTAQTKALFDHYKYSKARTEKERETTFRRSIDRTIVGIGAASVILKAWKGCEEWDEEEMLVILRSKRDSWRLARATEESSQKAA